MSRPSVATTTTTCARSPDASPDAMSEYTADSLTPQRVGAIRRRLLHWYDEHQQPFPWRTARDPWAALVAAVCAQQTQMSRVLPLWQRWMASFPTLQDAAGAPQAEALRVWGRGGYPRRALYLRRAAQQCVARHDGALPRDEAALLALPGVGPFTAAIVLAFGFGIDSAAVDTNVTRLFGRLVLGDLQRRPRIECGRDPPHLRAAHAAPRGGALESSRHGLRRRRLHAAPALPRLPARASVRGPAALRRRRARRTAARSAGLQRLAARAARHADAGIAPDRLATRPRRPAAHRRPPRAGVRSTRSKQRSAHL